MVLLERQREQEWRGWGVKVVLLTEQYDCCLNRQTFTDAMTIVAVVSSFSCEEAMRVSRDFESCILVDEMMPASEIIPTFADYAREG